MRIFKITFISLMLVIAGFFIWYKPPSTSTLTVMTFNIENGGTQIDFGKVVEAVKKSNADVVGLQEPWGHTAQLAHELGWKYYNNHQHIISRFPLFETTDGRHLYTLVEVKPGYVVAMANVHLPSDPYGPDMLKQGSSQQMVTDTEQTFRLPTVLPFIQKLSSLAKQGVPVFLTGDFNSPSHHDWRHHAVKIEWPITKLLEEAGWMDAYSEMHPDTLAATWPAGRPKASHSFDGFNPSTTDSPDRIDMIFTSGKSTVLSATIVAEPTYPHAKVKISPWPSDHRAMVASFKITPTPLSAFKLQPQAEATGAPTIDVAKHQLKSGEPLTIHWMNTPGDRYDYIMILPLGSKKTAWGEAVRLYTHGEINGTIVYDKRSFKGNWLDWHQASEGRWPLKPGAYVVRLMLDDGNTELGRTTITIMK